MPARVASSLEDVLYGAEPSIVRAVQQAILDHGGALDDPAWVPFAAALRVKIETQKLVPEAVVGLVERTSSEALGRFSTVLTGQVSKAVREVAQAASQASPAARSYRRALILGVGIGGVCALTVFCAGLWIGRALTTPPPASLASTASPAAGSTDDPQTRAVTDWAVGLGALDPLVRARIDRLLSVATRDHRRSGPRFWSKPGPDFLRA